MRIEVVGETWHEENEETESSEKSLSSDNNVENISDVVNQAVKAVVDHYRQKVHHSTASHIPYFVPVGDTQDQQGPPSPDSNPSAVLLYWLERFSGIQPCTSSNVAQKTDQPRETLVHSLLLSYLSHVRPLLSPPSFVEEAASVLTHFEILTAHTINRLMVSKGDSSNATRTGDQMSGEMFLALCDLVRVISSDSTLQIQSAFNLRERHDTEAMHDGTDVSMAGIDLNDRDHKEKKHRRELQYLLTTKVVIPILIRLLQYACNAIDQQQQSNCRISEEMTLVWTEVKAQSMITMLTFLDEREMGPQQIFPECVDRIENALQYVSPIYKNAAKMNDCHRAQNMNWNDLKLSTDEWDGDRVAFRTSLSFWSSPATEHSLDSPKNHNMETIASGSECLVGGRSSCSLSQTLFSHPSGAKGEVAHKEWVIQLAKAARAHFFGRDLYIAAPDHERAELGHQRRILYQSLHVMVIPRPRPLQTRLHLGRTVTEERAPYEKPYQEIPSRINVACSFIALLPEHLVNADILNELWPVVYELLGANQDTLIALGASCMCKLWKCWKGGEYSVQQQVGSNLHLLVTSAIKTCRDSHILALVGLAEQVLLEWFDKQGEPQPSHIRLRSLQNWLTIVEKNHTQRLATTWGCLVGGVLPSLSILTKNKNKAMELGRLGLMAFLPLVQMENMSQDDRFSSPFTNEVQWLSILALFSLLHVASEMVPRHGAKIMSALLVCMAGDGPANDQRVQFWGEIAAIDALEACGPRAKRMLDDVLRMCETGEYEESLCEAALRVQSKGIQQVEGG